jgi:DNA-binding response OmpR family regulator
MESKPIVLYVEDEALLALAIIDVLEEAGFQVEHVADGRAAIARLESGIGFLAALVTDVRLPGGIDGWEIAKRARELNGTVPVVYVSGDSIADWDSEGVPNSLALQKPFANAQLVTAITTLLNEAAKHPSS